MKKILLIIGLFILLFSIVILVCFNKTVVYGIKDYSNNNNIIQYNDTNIKISNEQLDLLTKINEERQKENLQPLSFRSDLLEIAKQKAEDLIENNYFSHTSQKYGLIFDMLKENNIEYKIAGENLAGARNNNLTLQGWLNSPTHKDNILEERYKYTGIYIINSNTYGKVYVQVFLG